MKKILAFAGQLDLKIDVEYKEDDIDEMIQKLDMGMQVRSS